jgi:hypothetical protein
MTAPIDALNTQLEALAMIRMLSRREADVPADMLSGLDLENEEKCLAGAEPYLWATDPTRACVAVAGSIPDDAPFDHNVLQPAVWWYFEEPLRVQTTIQSQFVKALNVARSDQYVRVAAWVEDQIAGSARMTVPTQVFTWANTDDIAGMKVRLRADYAQVYHDEDARYKGPLLGADLFIDAAVFFARFIMAATAWLDQKILVQEGAHVERHRRKDFTRATRRVPQLRVVHLRKVEREPSVVSGAGREWTCQWTVGGHWRQQPCGVKHGDRKLTWVHPYVKGPADKPLRVTPKINLVKR